VGKAILRGILREQAVLDTNKYSTKVRVPEAFDLLPIKKHDFHGEWNCTIQIN